MVSGEPFCVVHKYSSEERWHHFQVQGASMIEVKLT